MSFEKAGVIAAFAVVVFGVGAGWADLNSKVERIDKGIEKLAEDAADKLCLSIVTRQVAAIEQAKKEISKQLDELAKARGCYQRFDEVLVTGTSVHASLDDIINVDDGAEAAAWAATENKEQRELEARLVEIDRNLGLHRDEAK
jgi:multidrug resistance efflux pump